MYYSYNKINEEYSHNFTLLTVCKKKRVGVRKKQNTQMPKEANDKLKDPTTVESTLTLQSPNPRPTTRHDIKDIEPI